MGAILPMAMVVANKSAPASLGAAAMLASLSALLAGQGSALIRRYKVLMMRPSTLVVTGCGVLAVLSLTWSIDPAMSRRGLAEASPELVFAFMIAAAWPLVARRRDVYWLVGGLFGTALLMAFEHRFGMPLHKAFGARGEAWDLKRSAIPPVLLLWPAVAYGILRGRAALAVALLGACGVGIIVSHSGAPGFALVTALGFALLAHWAPKTALLITASGIALLILLGPWTGSLAGRLVPPGVTIALAEEHAAHRMRIWSAFEKRVPDHWIVGHGFDASFRVAQVTRPVSNPFDVDNADMLNNHPHNVFLEIWVELGLLGAAVTFGVFAWVLTGLGAMPARRLAPRLGLLVSVIGIGLVGLSAWQPWWLATIAASLLWFDLLAARFDG